MSRSRTPASKESLALLLSCKPLVPSAPIFSLSNRSPPHESHLTPHLRAGLPTLLLPAPALFLQQAHSDSFPQRTGRSSTPLPAEDSRPVLPPDSALSGRSDRRLPSRGAGPLLTSQTSAPETEPERYTGTGNLPVALRPAVATATAAATLRSPQHVTREGGAAAAQPR